MDKVCVNAHKQKIAAIRQIVEEVARQNRKHPVQRCIPRACVTTTRVHDSILCHLHLSFYFTANHACILPVLTRRGRTTVSQKRMAQEQQFEGYGSQSALIALLRKQIALQSQILAAIEGHVSIFVDNDNTFQKEGLGSTAVEVDDLSPKTCL